MQQIADWLEKLGLPQHAQSFAENDIDWSVLRYLNFGMRTEVIRATDKLAARYQRR
jgi:hypothetical protein